MHVDKHRTVSVLVWDGVHFGLARCPCWLLKSAAAGKFLLLYGLRSMSSFRKFIVICESSGFSPVPASRDDCSSSRKFI